MRRLAQRLQLEDVVVGIALVASGLLDGAGVGWDPLANDPLVGLVSLVAVIGAIAAIATRVPGESRFDVATDEPSRMWMIGPFIGGVGIVGGAALDRLGLPGGESLVGIAFLAALASILLGNRLPVVSRSTRRLLVTPFVALTAVLFHQLAGEAIDSLAGVEGLAEWLLAPENWLLSVNVLAILGLIGWIFYAMLIFVPRELADPGGSTWTWAVRFLVFYATLVAALLLGGAIPVLTP